MNRGDIWHLDLNPAKGREQQGARFVLIISLKTAGRMISKTMISKLDTKIRNHDIGVPRCSMKDVTITLDDEIAEHASIEAASRGQSLSQFVGELIERELGQKDIGREDISGLEAIEQFLSGPLLSEGTGPFTTRQDIYDERIDELVRRYERANLRGR